MSHDLEYGLTPEKEQSAPLLQQWTTRVSNIVLDRGHRRRRLVRVFVISVILYMIYFFTHSSVEISSTTAGDAAGKGPTQLGSPLDLLAPKQPLAGEKKGPNRLASPLDLLAPKQPLAGQAEPAYYNGKPFADAALPKEQDATVTVVEMVTAAAVAGALPTVTVVEVVTAGAAQVKHGEQAGRPPTPAHTDSTDEADPTVTVVEVVTAEPTPPPPSFNVQPYIAAILDPRDARLERQFCNATTSSRYEHLKIPVAVDSTTTTKVKYFFALDLHNCVSLLPSLIGATLEAIRYLGPEHCALSIVEGRSTDGTAEVLDSLLPIFNRLGFTYTLQRNNIDPKLPGGNRIKRLAMLRNQALEPLFNATAGTLAEDPIIVFINDVSLCLDDLLELIHQKVIQKADLACAMDWNMGGKIFYDAWIARDTFGEFFFEVQQGFDWSKSENLFPQNQVARRRFLQKKPFHVYACWNGIAVLNSKPFLETGIRFRQRREDECDIGEPTFLGKDLWNAGYQRVITVPSINVAYNLREGQEAKDNYGSTSWNVEHPPEPEDGHEKEEELITMWAPKPVHMLCGPNFSPRWWVTTEPSTAPLTQ